MSSATTLLPRGYDEITGANCVQQPNYGHVCIVYLQHIINTYVDQVLKQFWQPGGRKVGMQTMNHNIPVHKVVNTVDNKHAMIS